MAYWYYQVFKTVEAVRKAAKSLVIDHSRKDAHIAIRLAVLVFLFLLGYVVLILQSLYESVPGHTKRPAFDIAAVVCILIYWTAVPFAYGYTNKRLGVRSAIFFSPFGSTTARSRQNSKGSKLSLSPLPSADARTETSGTQTKDVVLNVTKTDNTNNDNPNNGNEAEEYVDPKSQKDLNESMGSSRIGLITVQDSGRTTPDISSTEPIQETPLIFNPFTSKPDFETNSFKETSHLDTSLSRQPTPLSPSTSMAENFRVLSRCGEDT
jgi:hypothetical protein